MPRAKTKSPPIAFRLDDDLYEILLAEAEREGQSPGEWTADKVSAALRKRAKI